jgi:Bacterial SH3 domain
MRGLSPILNLLTVLALAGTCLAAAVFAVLLAVPGAVPAFMRVATQPAQVAAVTPQPIASATSGLAYPTLPPEWTATPSPQPSSTNTALPPVTDTPTTLPGATATRAPAVRVTPSPTATSAKVVNIKAQANVRSGPSTAYPVVVRLTGSQTAPVIGRDSSGLWFAISINGAPQGTGWVSSLVATYGGNINDLPIIQPAGPPPTPAASKTPIGTPTATGVPNVNGIQTLLFKMRKTTGAINESLFFDFQVVNITGTPITYGILAAHTDQGYTADSWHDPLLPGKVLTWDDHINFSVSGTYLVYLGICYSGHDACKTGGAPWTRLSASTSVTIQ